MAFIEFPPPRKNMKFASWPISVGWDEYEWAFITWSYWVSRESLWEDTEPLYGWTLHIGKLKLHFGEL